MLDLVVLLTLSLLFMAALSLLFAGFVWTPWLIGLGLIGLLVALRRVTSVADQQLALGVMTQSDKVSSSAAVSSQPEALAHPEHAEPVMLYRGAKYKVEHSSEAASAAPSSPVTFTGKYRGTPWRRSQ